MQFRHSWIQALMQCIRFCLVLLLYNVLDTLGTEVASRPQFKGISSFLFQQKSPRSISDWSNLDLNLNLETSDGPRLVHVHLWLRVHDRQPPQDHTAPGGQFLESKALAHSTHVWTLPSSLSGCVLAVHSVPLNWGGRALAG